MAKGRFFELCRHPETSALINFQFSISTMSSPPLPLPEGEFSLGGCVLDIRTLYPKGLNIICE
jgi:hypothetical protein